MRSGTRLVGGMMKQLFESCEWKPHGKYGWIIVPPHKDGAARNRDDLKNRPYCAVCGKKIRVAEE